MLRTEWKASQRKDKVAEAAHMKLPYYNERLVFWRDKKQAVMATIRTEGLEVDERIAAGFSNPKSRNWQHGAQVMVRNDLHDDLEECLAKPEWHTARRDEYDGWRQVLCAKTDKSPDLDIFDWLFFFGRV